MQSYDIPWKTQTFNSFEKVASFIANRIQNSSGLYQMQHFLCDVVVIRDNNFIVYEEIPIKWIHVIVQGQVMIYYFKFGKIENKDWTFEFLFENERTSKNVFVHPCIIQGISSNTFVPENTIELSDDPTAEWNSETFINDLHKELSKFLPNL